MPDGSSPITPSLEIAKAFVKVLTGSADTVMRLRFVHDRDRENPDYPPLERENTLDGVWPEVLEYQARGYAVYYTMNVIKRGPGSGYGGTCTDEDTAAIRTLGTDHDDGLPREWHRSPAIVVHSSTVLRDGKEVQKGQALWPVKSMPIAEFKRAQQRLAAHYGTDSSV